jgi:hypothetical protein
MDPRHSLRHQRLVPDAFQVIAFGHPNLLEACTSDQEGPMNNQKRGSRENRELLEIDLRAEIDSAPAPAEPGGSSLSGAGPQPHSKVRGGRRGCFRTRWVSAPCDKCGIYDEVVHSPTIFAGFYCANHCPICTPAPNNTEESPHA